MSRAKRYGDFRYLNVSMPDDLLKKLDEFSNATRIPKNAITEMALRRYLAGVEGMNVENLGSSEE